MKIGLTATPALHTTDIFGDPIFIYSYRDAVIDGHLIDHEPPIRIETALARAGIFFKKDEQIDVLNTRTGEIDLVHALDEILSEVDKFSRQVVTPEFNRVVAEELAKHIDPALLGKDAPNLSPAVIMRADGGVAVRIRRLAEARPLGPTLMSMCGRTGSTCRPGWSRKPNACWCGSAPRRKARRTSSASGPGLRGAGQPPPAWRHQ